MKILIFFVTLTTITCSANAATDKIVCYYASWSIYRPVNAQLPIEDIPVDLCTHIIYAFISLEDNGTIKYRDPQNDLGLDAINRFAQLRLKNPNIVVSVAIGGGSEGSKTFTKVANNQSVRGIFVENIIEFMTKYNFNGFDLDWEYPTLKGGIDDDRQSYIELLKELRVQFDHHNWILTAAVPQIFPYQSAYNVSEMNKFLDFFHVMCYDMHHALPNGKTGQNSPLYSSEFDLTPYQKQLNVNSTIQDWISNGASPHKIILGLGFYGQSYTLKNAANNKLGDLVEGFGEKGNYSRYPGMLTYLEICEHQMGGDWTTVWDDEQKVPYTFSGNQWVGYDNIDSIKLKSQYAVANQLGGIMVWSVDLDDTRNICGNGTFPLLTAAAQIILKINQI